ncbi:hypothetical protein Fcan01_02211, partial [Folsomia candida]
MVMMMTSKNHGGGDLFCQLEGGRSRGKEDRRQTNGGEPPPKGPTTSNSCSDKCSLRDRFKRCLLESKTGDQTLMEYMMLVVVVEQWDPLERMSYKQTKKKTTTTTIPESKGEAIQLTAVVFIKRNVMRWQEWIVSCSYE